MRRRIIAGLHEAGFTDLQAGHLAVFAWPGPEGFRPGMLAIRADASKQAMNHLLGQLEMAGYLRRDPDPNDRRTRVVHLTARGRDAWSVLEKIVYEVEREWRDLLGDSGYEALQASLVELNRHFEGA
ncbi:MAG TPA: MarR family transcriptional regulator [Nocardioidaceae bacterium]|nr:MarR family transcriptional regulator [Nocardioidaceae bacterium]